MSIETKVETEPTVAQKLANRIYGLLHGEVDENGNRLVDKRIFAVLPPDVVTGDVAKALATLHAYEYKGVEDTELIFQAMHVTDAKELRDQDSCTVQRSKNSFPAYGQPFWVVAGITKEDIAGLHKVKNIDGTEVTIPTFALATIRQQEWLMSHKGTPGLSGLVMLTNEAISQDDFNKCSDLWHLTRGESYKGHFHDFSS